LSRAEKQTEAAPDIGEGKSKRGRRETRQSHCCSTERTEPGKENRGQRQNSGRKKNLGARSRDADWKENHDEHNWEISELAAQKTGYERNKIHHFIENQ
jgi:hypothetical protein